MSDLILACGGNPHEKKMWSGTPWTLIQKFEERGIRIHGYNMFSCLNRATLSLLKMYSKIFYYRVFARSPFLYGKCSTAMNTMLTTSSCKKVLFVAENIELRLPEIDYYIYIDALLKPRLQYSPFNKQTRRVGFKWFYNYYRKRDIASYMNAKYIFTQNEWTKNYLVEDYGINANKIFNIGFGVNLKPLTENKTYDNDLLLIVLRKGVEKLKGLYLLLEAFRIIRKSNPNVRLAVVGTELKSEEGVTYYYNQPRNVTVELFKQCTLYTMPALGEPNGVTYLEGLANKAPIVGLNRYAFPEFAGYGKYGFICKNENPEELAKVIIEALSDKERLARMGEAGQKYVMERYSWDLVVDKMLTKIYDKA